MDFIQSVYNLLSPVFHQLVLHVCIIQCYAKLVVFKSFETFLSGYCILCNFTVMLLKVCWTIFLCAMQCMRETMYANLY